MRNLLLLLAAGALGTSCAVDYQDAPTKLVGVGYDPNEIGPMPTPYGGVVEYSYVDFAGAGLNMALMGLGSVDEVGPGMVGFKPPYAAVYGFSYMFDNRLGSADSLAGVTSVPPDVPDTCYTTFAAGGPIGSFKTVDVGSYIEFSTRGRERDGGLRFERFPRDYPADAQNLFVYYMGFDYYTAAARYGISLDSRGRAEDVLVRKRNFPFGEEVEFGFPGAVTDNEMPIASMPRPSASVAGGNRVFNLPNAPGGVHVQWQGPRYDGSGREIGTGGQSTCLSYAPPANAPRGWDDCAPELLDSRELPTEGQIYTGPWDADDGRVTFRWKPGEASGEYVSLAVRFLGAIDEKDANFSENVVLVDPSQSAQNAWEQAQRQGKVPQDVAIPRGRRAPAACEDPSKVEGVLDDALLNGDGSFKTAVRGDPYNNVAEVTCRLDDDGEFTLTSEQLEQAMIYARRMGAQGAVFYFARSTETEAAVPAAKGQHGQRLDISPIKLTSRAIEIGRFWYEEKP